MTTISASIAQQSATARYPDTTLRRERRFFTGMAIAMAPGSSANLIGSPADALIRSNLPG